MATAAPPVLPSVRETAVSTVACDAETRCSFDDDNRVGRLALLIGQATM
jgi:hypothetical protein